MKLKFAALIAVLALTSSVFAAPLAPALGSITITGPDSWNATSITFPSQGTVQSATGTFAFLTGKSVDLQSFTFSSANGVTLFASPGAPQSALMDFVISGPVNVVSDTAQFLSLTGSGTFNEFLTLPAPGTFSLTSTAGGTTTFTINASTTPTPEPSSLILLGTALVSGSGMVLRRRRVRG